MQNQSKGRKWVTIATLTVQEGTKARCCYRIEETLDYRDQEEKEEKITLSS